MFLLFFEIMSIMLLLTIFTRLTVLRPRTSCLAAMMLNGAKFC